MNATDAIEVLAPGTLTCVQDGGRHGLRALDFVLSSGDLGIRKPAPAIFREALSRLGTPAERTAKKRRDGSWSPAAIWIESASCLRSAATGPARQAQAWVYPTALG